MKITLKRTLIGLGVTFIGYTLFAEFYNKKQSKKNEAERDLITQQARDKPQEQEYENGLPVVRASITYMEKDLVSDAKGKIFNPWDLIRNFNPFFGLAG